MQEFHAFQVSPGSEHTLEVPQGQGFHLSMVSLPHNQNSGRSTLYVSVDGKSYAVATVDAQRSIMQVTADLIFNFEQKAVFQVKGTTAVHCVGYRQELDTEDEDMPFGFDDSEDDEGPLNLPVEQATGGATVEQLDSDDDGDDEEEDNSGDEEDDLEDEEMSDEEESGADAPADPTQAGASDDEDDEEEDDDDEEMDDEESGDEEIDEEESDDEEDDDDDEEVLTPPTKAARPEGRSSQGGPSPAKGQNSPQGRGSNGAPSPRKSQGSPQQARGSQGSPSRGTPNRGSQGRRSH